MHRSGVRITRDKAGGIEQRRSAADIDGVGRVEPVESWALHRHTGLARCQGTVVARDAESRGCGAGRLVTAAFENRTVAHSTSGAEVDQMREPPRFVIKRDAPATKPSPPVGHNAGVGDHAPGRHVPAKEHA